jgi:hypothetical protein
MDGYANRILDHKISSQKSQHAKYRIPSSGNLVSIFLNTWKKAAKKSQIVRTVRKPARISETKFELTQLLAKEYACCEDPSIVMGTMIATRSSRNSHVSAFLA